MAKGKILIAVPSRSGQVTTEFMQLYTNIIVDLLTHGYQIGHAIINRAFIDEARNNFLQRMEEEDADWIFFLDDDTFITPDGIRKMIELDKDIVAPPVACRKGSDWINVFDEEGENMPKEKVTETMQIGGTGMACTLIKREVVRALRQEYDKPFEFQIAKNPEGRGIYLSEDISFCYRARRHNFEVWAIKGIRTMHMGDPNLYVYEG